MLFSLKYLTVSGLKKITLTSKILIALCIVFHKTAIQNIYNVFYSKTSLMCIFNAVKLQLGIGFIVDALFDNFAYLHNLYTILELHTNFVLMHFESQPYS